MSEVASTKRPAGAMRDSRDSIAERNSFMKKMGVKEMEFDPGDNGLQS